MMMIPQFSSLVPATRTTRSDQPGGIGDDAAARDFRSVLGGLPTDDRPTDDSAARTSGPTPTQPDKVELGKEAAGTPDSAASQPVPEPVPATGSMMRPASTQDATGSIQRDHAEALRADFGQMPTAANLTPGAQDATRQALHATPAAPSDPDLVQQSQTPDSDRPTSDSLTNAPVASPDPPRRAGSAETSVLLRATDQPGSATLPANPGISVQDHARPQDRGNVATPETAPDPVVANPSSDASKVSKANAEAALIARPAGIEPLTDDALPQSRQSAGGALGPANPLSHPAAAPGPGTSGSPVRYIARATEAAVLLRATDLALSTAPAVTPPPTEAITGQPKATIAVAPSEPGTVAQALSPDVPTIPQPPVSGTLAALPPLSLQPSPEPTAAPPLPPATAPAIVLAVGQNGGGLVELVLTPEDLGRLRFEVTQTGDLMRIHLTVERPETLELLRRNADQLLAEFRQAGYAGATLSFAQGGQGEQHPPAAPATARPVPAPEEQTLPPTPQGQTHGGGLDLRL